MYIRYISRLQSIGIINTTNIMWCLSKFEIVWMISGFIFNYVYSVYKSCIFIQHPNETRPLYMYINLFLLFRLRFHERRASHEADRAHTRHEWVVRETGCRRGTGAVKTRREGPQEAIVSGFMWRYIMISMHWYVHKMYHYMINIISWHCI